MIVAYGVSILTISENLMETVKYKVEEFTGMQIDKILSLIHILTPDMRAILTELNIADDYFKAKAQVEKLELDLEAKEREIYNLKHDLISNQVQTETNTQRIEELEAENKELLLNKTKLEAALEDSLLGKVTSAKTDKKEEKETT